MSAAEPRTRSPRRPPSAAGGGTVIALLLIVVAVVTVHDLLTARGWTSGEPWLATLADRLDGKRPGVLTDVVGVVACLVGLVLLRVSLRPARRTHQAAPIEGDVWISRRAVQRLARLAAERTTGVESARVVVRRRSVRTSVRTIGDDVAERVRENTTRALAGLTEAPVRVSAKAVRDDR